MRASRHAWSLSSRHLGRCVPQECSRFFAASTRVGECRCWINAEGECAALSRETVVQPPVTRAVWLDEEVHAPTVAEFVWLGFRLGVADVGIGQRHDGISGSRPPAEPCRSTVIDTDKFYGCKRSVTGASELLLANSIGISEF